MCFCVIQKAHLVFPVLELFCRSVWCGRVQNRAQDRGWALLNMSYSNTTSASSMSHNPSFQSVPPLFSPHLSHHARSLSLPPLPLLLFSSLAPHPPPSSASSSPALLPPPVSSCIVSRPCSQSRSPCCPGNGVRLGALARHYTAEFLPEVSATALEMWMLQQTAGQVVRSYLAELVQLLKQLVVNNE